MTEPITINDILAAAELGALGMSNYVYVEQEQQRPGVWTDVRVMAIRVLSFTEGGTVYVGPDGIIQHTPYGIVAEYDLKPSRRHFIREVKP